MTRKFGDLYRCVKNVYPDAYKLPEEEIKPMTRIARTQGNTIEETQNHLNDYVKKNQPKWQQTYFGNMQPNQHPQMPQPNTNGTYATQPQNTTTEGLSPLTPDTLGERERLARNIAPKTINWYNDKEYDNQFLNRISPAYATFDAGSLLYDKYKEMQRNNLIGGDNYYHRLAMCELGQKGSKNPFYLPLAMGGGVLKEGYDIGKKTLKEKNPLMETLKDSYKDMNNNIEGYSYGVMHPEDNCYEWLQDLDINNNTWKK